MQGLGDGFGPLEQLISPFLNPSNSLDCSWNMAIIESGLSQLSILEANGWSQGSFPVLLVYSVKAALKIASKLEEMEVLFEAEDMGITEMSYVVVEEERERCIALRRRVSVVSVVY